MTTGVPAGYFDVVLFSPVTCVNTYVPTIWTLQLSMYPQVIGYDFWMLRHDFLFDLKVLCHDHLFDLKQPTYVVVVSHREKICIPIVFQLLHT